MPTFNETPVASFVIVPSTFSVATLIDKRVVTVVFPATSVSWHGLGGIETVIALWSQSCEAFQSPQVVGEPDVLFWEWLADVRDVMGFDNIGTPGQTYQVGSSRRNVSPTKGRTQVVSSSVSVL